MTEEHSSHTFRDSIEDARASHRIPDTPQSRSPAYRLAFIDEEFMMRPELRPVRLQLELLKPQMVLDERGIESTVVMFGGARIPAPEKKETAKTPALAELSHFYEEARRFARAVTERSLETYGRQLVVCTGGGPGVMEAGNLGAHEAGGQSIGLNIMLPHEQAPNAWVTPDLSFNFHYFAIRKMHFLMRARAVCVFPGGFGTLDEMFEALTLIQTRRMRRIPFILFGTEFWKSVVNWTMLAEAGTISPQDLELISFVETAADALAIIDGWDYGCE
ncbi:LOG family protein [Sinirhodobacter ferrireducens]|uniref:AMP nucleosidase n=1 Tax=Paenirhodobacter ferrireducens TaxID=1215032 RepID=A0A443LBU7_9RHOB|nr:LOG family protein [Sinirhodobacter ferrireducens]RWR46657.1 LOG family protein [Sinirhodobacter ferrireducens]